MENRVQKLKPNRHHDSDFKASAVRMVILGGTVKDVSSSLAIKAGKLYSWIKESKSEAPASVSEERTELERLRKALAQTEMERDILKKALSIIGRAT